MQRVKKAIFFCWIRVMPIIAPKISILLVIIIAVNALNLTYQRDRLEELKITPISQLSCGMLCGMPWTYQQISCCPDSTWTNCVSKSECYPHKLQAVEGEYKSARNMIILFSCVLFAFLAHFGAVYVIAKKWAREIDRQDNNEHQARQPSQDNNISAQPLMEQSFVGEQNEQICVICQNEFQESRAAKLNCGHLFHSDCINSWRARSRKCPLCKRIHE